MKFTNLANNETMALPKDLYSVDELNWSKVASAHNRTLDGTLLIEQSVKKHGKPFVLSADDDMAWLTRQEVNRLLDWASLTDTRFLLEFWQDGISKSITVMFDHTSDPIKARPVKNYNSPNLDDYFIVSIHLIQVA